jgi:hypothetical protein
VCVSELLFIHFCTPQTTLVSVRANASRCGARAGPGSTLQTNCTLTCLGVKYVSSIEYRVVPGPRPYFIERCRPLLGFLTPTQPGRVTNPTPRSAHRVGYRLDRLETTFHANAQPPELKLCFTSMGPGCLRALRQLTKSGCGRARRLVLSNSRLSGTDELRLKNVTM